MLSGRYRRQSHGHASTTPGNLSLKNMHIKGTPATSSTVTEKYVSNISKKPPATYKPLGDIPDVISSSFNAPDPRTKPRKFYSPNFTIDRPIFNKNESSSGSGQTSSVVRSIIDSLNRKERSRFDIYNRGGFGRSSLKVMGNSKIDVKTNSFRSPSPEEFSTAL